MAIPDSVSFDDIAFRLTRSLWYRPVCMTLSVEEGYPAPGHFGLRQGKRLSVHGFYENLARALLALMTQGKSVLAKAHLANFTPGDNRQTAMLLAIQYQLTSADEPSLSPRDFWEQQGALLLNGKYLNHKPGVERLAVLSDLQKAFYRECDALPFDDIMNLHIDLCQQLRKL